jgi:hypothetical protein
MVVRLCCRSKRREGLVQQHSVTSRKTWNLSRTGERVRTVDSRVSLGWTVQQSGLFGCLVSAVGPCTSVLHIGVTADWREGRGRVRREVMSKNKLRPSALLSRSRTTCWHSLPPADPHSLQDTPTDPHAVQDTSRLTHCARHTNRPTRCTRQTNRPTSCTRQTNRPTHTVQDTPTKRPTHTVKDTPTKRPTHTVQDTASNFAREY